MVLARPDDPPAAVVAGGGLVILAAFGVAMLSARIPASASADRVSEAIAAGDYARRFVTADATRSAVSAPRHAMTEQVEHARSISSSACVSARSAWRSRVILLRAHIQELKDTRKS